MNCSDQGRLDSYPADAHTKLFLQWKNVEVMVATDAEDGQVQINDKSYKPILRGVSGHSNPGELLAIVGPSGCGKTTLLHYISQRFPKSLDLLLSDESELTVNGKLYSST